MNETIKSNIVDIFNQIGYGEAVRYAATTLNLGDFDDAILIVDSCLG